MSKAVNPLFPRRRDVDVDLRQPLWFRGVGLSAEDTFQLKAFSCTTDSVSPFPFLKQHTPAFYSPPFPNNGKSEDCFSMVKGQNWSENLYPPRINVSSPTAETPAKVIPCESSSGLGLTQHFDRKVEMVILWAKHESNYTEQKHKCIMQQFQIFCWVVVNKEISQMKEMH